jgi:hypothetical protein
MQPIKKLKQPKKKPKHPRKKLAKAWKTLGNLEYQRA